jgi:hypothetical protein
MAKAQCRPELSGAAKSAFQKFDAIAKSEGWAIFEVDGSYLSIQKLDEENVFENDTQAVEFIIQKAIHGSRFHAIALLIDNMPISDNDINWDEFAKTYIDTLQELS